MASGEMDPAEFTDFLKKALQNLADHSMDGSIHFIFMDWRHMQEVIAAGNEVSTYSMPRSGCSTKPSDRNQVRKPRGRRRTHAQ